MRKVALLAAMAATSVLLPSSAWARMGTEKKGSGRPSKDMSTAVDFQTFELEGEVHDLMWCG